MAMRTSKFTLTTNISQNGTAPGIAARLNQVFAPFAFMLCLLNIQVANRGCHGTFPSRPIAASQLGFSPHLGIQGNKTNINRALCTAGLEASDLATMACASCHSPCCKQSITQHLSHPSNKTIPASTSKLDITSTCKQAKRFEQPAGSILKGGKKPATIGTSKAKESNQQDKE